MATWAQEVAADTPQIWHRFNDTSGSSGSLGLSTTATSVTYIDGIRGRAAQALSTNTQVAYTLPADIYNGQWTIEAWFKIQAANFYNNICRISHTDGSKHIGLRVRGSNHASTARPNITELFTYDGTAWGAVQGGTVNVNDNVWHHVVVKAEGTATQKNLIMFIDGVNVSSSPGDPPLTRAISGLTGQTQKVLAGPDPSEYFQNGAVDECIMYNYALSNARIVAHYNAPNSAPPFRGWGLRLP